MIVDSSEFIINDLLSLEGEYDGIYVVCLGEKKFALNSTAYFLATNSQNQCSAQLIEHLMEHFSIDLPMRSKVEIECRECLEMLISNNILLSSEGEEQ